MRKAILFTIFLFVTFMIANGIGAQTPDWQWVTKAGGSSVEYVGDWLRSGSALAYDPQGNSYVTGAFYSSTATFGTTTLTNSGGYDIYVAKLDPNGNWLWATKAGGTGDDGGCSITIDSQGNSYVTGQFGQSFATATFGTITLTA